MLKTDPRESLKSVSKWTTEVSWMKSKQFETEVVGRHRRLLVDFKYKTDKHSGELKTSFSECTVQSRKLYCNAAQLAAECS